MLAQATPNPFHLLIIAIGSAGDVHPYLAIGRAALLRGHRVTLCTSPYFQSQVESGGMRFLPLGTLQNYTRAMGDPRLWAPRTSLQTLWAAISQTLDAVATVTAREAAGRTVVLGSLWSFGARAVQECTGVPYLSAHVSPSTLLSAYAPPEHPGCALPRWWPLALRRAALRLAERLVIDRLMAPALNRLRRRADLPPVRRVMTRWMHSPDGVLALFPEWFAPPQPDWPQPLTCTGFPLADAPGDDRLDDGLSAFLAAGSAPVVVTAGSTHLADAGFHTRALAAVQALGRRAIVLAGTHAVPAELPTWAVSRPYVDFSALLPRCAAIVHHGGVGTAAAALHAGVPQLVLPFAHDQFDNAARVVALGAGLRLRADAGADAVHAALSELLQGGHVRAACEALALRSQADCGPRACDRALAVVEALAAARLTPAPRLPVLCSKRLVDA